MARVKICPSCAAINARTASDCASCPADLMLVRDVEEAAPDGVATTAPATGPVCPNPDCGETNARGRQRCIHCDASLETPSGARAGSPVSRARAATIEWSWGAISVEERIGIGREPEFSPLAEHFTAKSNISRFHAEIYREGDTFYLVDVGSCNGTWVNDRMIPPRLAMPLRDGDRLRFASDVCATFRSPCGSD